jgi:hypothetical protein
MNENENRITPGVLFRDFLIFNLKLLMDGGKGLVLVQVAAFAFCMDMIFLIAGRRRPDWFYRVLRLGERFDQWLSLYRPSQGAGQNPDGLFGESRAGDNTFLGEMEELVRRRPEPVAHRAGGGTPGSGAPRVR